MLKKVVLAPDSFKGTLSAAEVCRWLCRAMAAIEPQCRVVSLPIADGGEGTVDAFLTALGGEKVRLWAQGPFGEPTSAVYARLPDGTAVIEMAACAGLPLATGRENPERATTYGVGQLLLHAAEHGAERFIVGLGGSATNDGGCGAAAACGVRFYDGDNRCFVPTGGTLGDICRIDPAGLDSRLKKARFTVMCDIDNPLYGPLGAACVFAPQKGANAAMVQRLDQGLRHLAALLRRDTGTDCDRLPGGGAAGGMGAGMAAFFGAELRSGIETVLDAADFDRLIADADLIVTGEGRLDGQSLRGKAVLGVARRAQAQNKPVLAVVGGVAGDQAALYQAGITAVVTACRLPETLADSAPHAGRNLQAAMEDALRLLRCGGTLTGR